MSIVREFTGHFIGRELHMDPHIKHYGHKPIEDVVLRPGMTFTIEPIVAALEPAIQPAFDDGWSFVTRDFCWSAQMEHTVLVTENGNEILTRSQNSLDSDF